MLTERYNPFPSSLHLWRVLHPRNTDQAVVEKLVAAGLAGNDNTIAKRDRALGFANSARETDPRPNQSPRRKHRNPPDSVVDQGTEGNPSRGQKQSAHLRRQSSLAQLKAYRSSMANKGRETRRERTFIGSECAACEEPLEHTLRGERILQFSCGHIAHEACLYEYVRELQADTCPTCNAPLELDTSRGGGGSLDNITRLLRSVQRPEVTEDYRDPESTPTPWNHEPQRQPFQPATPNTNRFGASTRDHPAAIPFSPTQTRHSDFSRHDSQNGIHERSHSNKTSPVAGGDHGEGQPMSNGHGRKHDFDVQSMETKISHPRHMAKNPVPPPTVTVRSEFPTLSKARQQQSLTCLITVEAVEGKWKPSLDDLQGPAVPAISHEESFELPKRAPPEPSKSAGSVHEEHESMAEAKEKLFRRVDNWHGLDYTRFGRLILHGTMKVGKDRQTWQELECYLFTEMLICVREKKIAPNAGQRWDGTPGSESRSKCTLKGSILIRKHLKQVDAVPDFDILTLSLSVAELPAFHLQFHDRSQLEIWRRSLNNMDGVERQDPLLSESEQEQAASDEDDSASTSKAGRRVSSIHSSSYGASRSQVTAPTEYTNSRVGLQDMRPGSTSIHVPLDIVVVIPVSSSMHGLKINLLRDALRFLVSGLGARDRMGLVTFGSGAGGMPLVGMTTKTWSGWSKVLDSIRPLGQKSMRADVVEGANVAVDLLMQRKTSNPLASILLISDSATADHESIDFVVSRAEAAKITIHSFGLGLTHKPDTMVELSTRTKASYTYVKDWMMLRDCVAGCLGSLQTTSHQNVKLRLKLPEGSPAKFVKISGALQITKRATGRDAEASLGDLRFGDKRDILVQLAIAPDTNTPDSIPSDPWENIISGLEALGGGPDQDDGRALSIEELPLIQADLCWGDILREGSVSQLPRPSLLAITMLPSGRKGPTARPLTPPIPPHPSIVQRRMELLTSDMLSRALTLISKGQQDRAHHLLTETRSILKGLGKGGLPPLPPPSAKLPPTPVMGETKGSPIEASLPLPPDSARLPRTPSPPQNVEPFHQFNPAAGIDTATMTALDSELESSLEWISHPAQFGRDSRKAVLQAIGVISSQRGFSFRTPAESLWAARIPGIRHLSERSREWRERSDEFLAEEG